MSTVTRYKTMKYISLNFSYFIEINSKAQISTVKLYFAIVNDSKDKAR